MMTSVKHLIRSLVFRILFYMGMYHLFRFINRLGSKVPILLYHRVSPHRDKFWEALHPQEFELHIRFLSKRYQFVSLDDLFRLPKAELKDSCSVVFDDAFLDFFEYALPIMRRYNVPVSMFVPIDCIDRNQIIWTSQVDNCFKFTNRSKLEISTQEGQATFSLGSEAERIAAAGYMLQFLKGLPNNERVARLEWLKKELGYKEDVHVAPMTWTQITSTRNEVTYHSHTMTHPVLSSIKDPSEIQFELGNPRIRLSEVLGPDPKYIAYPVGDCSPEAEECAKKVYRAGFVTGNRLMDLNKIQDPNYRFRIPRFNIHDSSPFELIFRINGFHALFSRSGLYHS